MNKTVDPTETDPKMVGRWTIGINESDPEVSFSSFYDHLSEDNHLVGGVGDALAPSDVDTAQLALGTQIEMEHTNNNTVATEIALDHLKEDPRYYTKLIQAGLAPEFKPQANSGFGDPNQSFNDPSRIGQKSPVISNNKGGKIGDTPTGQINGRRSHPILNKTIDIDINDPQILQNLLPKVSLASIFTEIYKKYERK